MYNLINKTIKNHSSDVIDKDIEKMIEEGIRSGKSEKQILKEMLQEEAPRIDKSFDSNHIEEFLKEDYKLFENIKGLKAEERKKTSIDPKVY